MENSLKNMEIDEKKSSFSKKKDIEDAYNKYFSHQKERQFIVPAYENMSKNLITKNKIEK